MFTGIVETTGLLQFVGAHPGGSGRVRITSDLDLRTVPIGGSVSVNGVCLTAVAKRGRWFEADLGPETLAITTLGSLTPKARVHLERPLRAGDPLGGHLVAGHVDGTGVVKSARPVGDAFELVITAPRSLAALITAKGSICIDGVSLTVNRVRGASFQVLLIPHTLAVTALGGRRPGDAVNLEVDWLAKQVARLLDGRRGSLITRIRSARRPRR